MATCASLKKRRSSQRKVVATPFVLNTHLSIKELQEKFLALFPKDSLPLWMGGKVFYQRAFSPLIILWYLVFQHLLKDSTLESVVEDARDGGADPLSPRGKRLSMTLSSDSTSSWADARRRLPVEVVHNALRASGQTVLSTVAKRQWHGLDPVLVDGTTSRLRPLGDIPEHFPAHRSGKSTHPYWCLARAVVAFCAATGVVLDCVLDPLKRSEQALFLDMLANTLWVNSLFVADRNFGVYSVARGIDQAKAKALLRLTKSRANKLAKDAGLKLCDGLDELIEWKPTRHDQCPENSSKTPVSGRLIAVHLCPRGFCAFTLYLFTTLMDFQITSQELVQLYGLRWQVELNLRYLKTQLKLEVLNCKSAAMARKLWFSGLMAYNVVRAVMCSGAALSGQPVRALSFTRCLKALRRWLPRAGKKGALASWGNLLKRVAQLRLPRRKAKRPCEPRAIRYFKRDFPKLLGNRVLARAILAPASAKC